MLKYKGFIGHFSFDEKTHLFHGNVANSHDLITFQGASVMKIQQVFQDAVDEHIEWCQTHAKRFELSPSQSKNAK